VQKFWTSVKIWQSYRPLQGENFFETQCRTQTACVYVFRVDDEWPVGVTRQGEGDVLEQRVLPRPLPQQAATVLRQRVQHALRHHESLRQGRQRRSGIANQRPDRRSVVYSCMVYIGWQWRNFLIPYLATCFSRHDVGQADKWIETRGGTSWATCLNLFSLWINWNKVNKMMMCLRSCTSVDGCVQ